MKKSPLQDLRNKSRDDLLKELESSRNQLRQFKIDIAGGKVKNVREARKLKKVIAVIYTLLKEKNNAQ